MIQKLALALMGHLAWMQTLPFYFGVLEVTGLNPTHSKDHVNACLSVVQIITFCQLFLFPCILNSFESAPNIFHCLHMTLLRVTKHSVVKPRYNLTSLLAKTKQKSFQTHALSLRRAVPGRQKPFDELLAEHKARVNCEKEQQQNQALKLQEQAATQKALDTTLKRTTSTISDSSVTSSASSRFVDFFS